MRMLLSLAITCCEAVSLSAIASPAFAAIVDRIAITVGDKAITESEIVRRIRLEAFQNAAPADFSLTSWREAAQRLIDLKLVEREMELGNYVRTPPDRAEELLTAFTAEHFHSSAEALRLALAKIGLTPADLRTELAEQADVLSFTNLRFRPAVDISDREIEEYYRNHIQSANAANTAANPVTLADARANIERILANERADLDLDAWLRDQRQRIRIIYVMKELQ